MRIVLRRRLLLAVVLGISLASRASAVPGDLDTQFGGFGVGGIIDDLGFQAEAAALDAQGRLVLAGRLGGTFHVQRRSGPRFETVESASIVILSNQASATARAVAIAPDGKIVLGGTVNFGDTGNDFAVARFNDDLTPDTTFSADGVARTDLGDSEQDEGFGVAVQDDLKVVIVGSTLVDAGVGLDIAVARFNPDGTLDDSFAGNGQAIFNPTDLNEEAYAVALDGDKILLAGSASVDFIVARLNGDGSLDESFGDDGYAKGQFGATGEAFSLALGPDGKIAAAGAVFNAGLAVARFLNDGTPDGGFGNDGAVTTDPSEGSARAFGVAVQRDGKIVALSRITVPDGPDPFFLTRYNLNGTLDTSYDGDGQVFTFFDEEGVAEALVMQPDGWVVASGGRHAARYRSDGSLDAGGIVQVVFDPLQTAAEARALAVDNEDRLVAAGHVQIATDSNDVALARFRADDSGILDTEYGNGDPKLGTTVYGSPLDEQIHAMVLQGDGKAIVAGQIGSSPNLDFLIGRYDASGAHDPTCAFAGYNVQDFEGGDDIGRSVGFGSGILFVGGTVAGPGGGADFGAAPFNASDCTLHTGFGLQRVDMGATDLVGGSVVQVPRLPIGVLEDRVVLAGSTAGDIGLTRFEAEMVIGGLRGASPAAERIVDTSFGTNGKTIVPTGGDERVTAIRRLSNGLLLVAGWNVSIDNSDFFVARFTAGGLLDTTFGTDGFAYAHFALEDTANALAVRADGSIAVAGCSNNFGMRFAVAQFTPTGQLDTGFDDDGMATVQVNADEVECANAVTFVQPDRLVLGGYSTAGGARNFSLVQLETTRDATIPVTTTTTLAPTTTIPSTSTTVQPTTTTVDTTTTTVPDDVCGDPNDDGSITATDALFVLRAAVGSVACEPCVCDADDSGSISAPDALRVLRVAVGQAVTLNCPDCS